MAISGSYNWQDSIDRNTLIGFALQHIGAIGIGETASANQITQASFWLNAFIKHWQADGMQLWKTRFGYVLPQTGDHEIGLGTSGDHATLSYTKTELSAAAASGATTLTVDSITGISASNNIGIELDDDTMHWTTVSGAPSGSTVTLATGLASAAAIDSHVFVYSHTNSATGGKLQRPLRVFDAWRRDQDSQVDTPMQLDERINYMSLGDKDTTGQPTRWYYDPQLDTGVLYIHPRFSDGQSVLVLSCQYPFSDMDSATDNFDLPAEWILPCTLMLAYYQSASYGIPPEERKVLFQEAMAAKAVAMGFDSEEGSIKVMPDARASIR